MDAIKALLIAVLTVSVQGFVPHPSPLAVRAAAPSTRSTSALSMGFFDNAFKNEDLGKKPDAGGVAKKKTVEVKVLGKPMQAMPGQRLKDIVRASRAPIRFNCENGQCGTCEQKVNGRKTRICVTAVPAGGCQITKL